MKTTENIHGVLLLNKDSGESSNRALQRAKRLFNAAKAGHTGSLDPLASGVLPICFGEATKFSQFLLDADKTYVVTAKLGVTTTTSDAEGEILEIKLVPQFTREQILAAIAKFIGVSKQIPSMYSALKHKGQPLYKLARQNITVERPARDIFVYEYELLDFNYDVIKCRIKCSKGTYIRNLIEDLGVALGCGAHVTALQRTQAGGFDLEQSYTLAELEEAILAASKTAQAHSAVMPESDQTHNTVIPEPAPLVSGILQPLETLIQSLPSLTLNPEHTQNLRHGKVIPAADYPVGVVAVFSSANELIGIGETLSDGTLVAKRLLATGLK